MSKDLENSTRGIELAQEIVKVMRDDNVSTSLDEYALIKEMLDSEDGSSVELFNLICDEKQMSEQIASFDGVRKSSSISQFKEKLEFKARRRASLRNSLRYVSSIAAVVFLFCFVSYLFVREDSDIEMVQLAEGANDITITVPTLISEDGSIVRFEKDKIYSSTLDLVSAADTAEMILNHSVKTEDLPERYNKIVVPNKFTFTVRLSDGTEVRLNANSELSYPISFGKNERKVYLKGEGFFTVAKTDVPFVVSTDRGDAKVYGTRFNVNLNRSKLMQVLLVDGSIGVTPLDSVFSKEVMMKPLQLLECSGSSKVLLDNVDISNYIGWLDGTFRYNHIGLSDLLQELSSWYGVGFDFRCDVSNMKLSINVNRDIELNKLLNIIESMIKVRFIKEKGGLYSVN